MSKKIPSYYWLIVIATGLVLVTAFTTVPLLCDPPYSTGTDSQQFIATVVWSLLLFMFSAAASWYYKRLELYIPTVLVCMATMLGYAYALDALDAPLSLNNMRCDEYGPSLLAIIILIIIATVTGVVTATISAVKVVMRKQKTPLGYVNTIVLAIAVLWIALAAYSVITY